MSDPYRPVTSSLRSRLLLLTVLFVSVFEVLVYFPAIATYRQNFLEERLIAAQIAALSLEEAPGRAVSPMLETELLETAGVISVIMLREDKSLMLGGLAAPDDADADYDLRSQPLAMMIADALETLDAEGNRVVHVIGEPELVGTRFVEITLDESDLYEAMAAFSNNMLVLSLVISVFTGILVYLALHWLVVRPMRRVKDSIIAFRRDPEQERRLSRGQKRWDEIGVVERELARMQDEVRLSLKQKTRLAELGEAVAKINHDLRNILATTTLASEALSRVDHPRVQRISGRLINAVNRAVALCERTLSHGKADEPEPEKQDIVYKELVLEVAGTLGLLDDKGFTFDAQIDDDLLIHVDPHQFHRVLMNLCRNAVDAQGLKGHVGIRAEVDKDGTVHTHLSDHGPGIPDQILPNLFKPFSRSAKGSTGLGMSIARDIVRAHGGQIGLEATGPEGTTIIICIPGKGQTCSAS